MHQVPMPQTTSTDPAAAPASPTIPSPGVKPKFQKKQLALKQIPYPFWFGGSASSMAACVTHPLDLGMFGWSN